MEQVKIYKSSWVEYLFLGFILLWSGGSFTPGVFESWPFILTIIAFYLVDKRNLRLDFNNIVLIVLFTVVFIFQTISYGGTITSIVAPILRLLAIALLTVLLRPNLKNVFIKIVFFFALISLFFWIIDLTPQGHASLLGLANSLPQLGGEKLAEIEGSAWSISGGKTLYLYTVYSDSDFGEYYSMSRNAGPFFEPGRFAIPLMIALALILFNDGYKKYKTEFYVILIAVITTFSTTAFFALFAVLISYVIGRNRKQSLSNAVLLLIFFIAGYYLLQASYISDKVIDAMENTENANSRFGAVLYHWSQIVQSPIIGYGIHLNTVFKGVELSPCGITAMMRQWGIPLFIICVVRLFKGTNVLMPNNLVYRLTFTFTLLLLAYTQTIMDSPLYYLFYFISIQHAKIIKYGKKT